MTESGQPEQSLSRLLPSIRRARGYRIYDAGGKRYLDLQLAGGRALLGHRPERVLHELKNLASRGLLGDFPSVFERRLAKALAKLVPDHPVVRVFGNEERLADRLGEALGASQTIVDPVIENIANVRAGRRTSNAAGRESIWRWRPYFPGGDRAPLGVSVAVPVLPFPGSFVPAVACIRGAAESTLPPSDPVSPALLGALARSAYDLLQFMERGTYGEETWARFDCPWWERRGPYLVACCEKGEYSEIFCRLLEKGIHISPEYPGPSLVPAEFSEGELGALRELAGSLRRG